MERPRVYMKFLLKLGRPTTTTFSMLINKYVKANFKKCDKNGGAHTIKSFFVKNGNSVLD